MLLMLVVCKVPVLGHFFIQYFLLWAPRGLYGSSFVTRSTLLDFAFGVMRPLCFLRVKDWHTKFVSSYGRHVTFVFLCPVLSYSDILQYWLGEKYVTTSG